MSTARKAFLIGLPVTLTLAIILVFAYDTFAAYYKGLDQTSSAIGSKTLVFNVNGSGAQSVQLPNMTVTPNGTGTWTVTLDARGSEVPLNATFALNLSYSSWPPGLSAYVNNTKITPGSTYTLSYPNIRNTSPQNVSIKFAWDTSDYCRTDNWILYLLDLFAGKPQISTYDGHQFTATATLTATQSPS